jgi:hypothetical protein
MELGMPKCRGDLGVRQVGEELIVLDRRSNRVHQLNVTAGFVWQRLDGRHTVEQIVDELVAAFGVERQIADRDARRVLAELSQLGVLETDPVV